MNFSEFGYWQASVTCIWFKINMNSSVTFWGPKTNIQYEGVIVLLITLLSAIPTIGLEPAAMDLIS